jgi:ribosomal protein S18 acetylase RimI-like enzyme
MRITVRKKLDQQTKKMIEAEWKLYDNQHFGKTATWNRQEQTLCAFLNKNIAGTLDLRIEAGVGTIRTVIVKRDYQRRGVASALIAKAIALARARGAHKVYLITGKTWNAVKLYQKLGFSQENVLRRHYFGIDFVEMSKFLD